jgi:putative heme-binding domain-containing protein
MNACNLGNGCGMRIGADTCWVCRLAVTWLLIALCGGYACLAADPPRPIRQPWTSSRVVGSPDPPPPFKVVRAFPNLKFDKPLLMARCPGSDRLFVGEQAGVLYSFENRPDAQAELFCDLRTEIKSFHLLAGAQAVDAVYGLAFHPEFERNRQCFVCYTLSGKRGSGTNLADGTRVSRFTVTKTDPPRIEPASEEIVFTYLQGGHNGGDIHFGPDGLLYISTGDAASPNPPDPFNTGQDISDLMSSILRIDADRKDEGKNYAVPKDNPFVAMPGARPEVWAYGFRNPWRMSFDRQTGELFVGDVGWELWELVHRIEKGGNYGWAAMEGPQPIKPEQQGPTPVLPALIALPHTISASITGGYVYRGERFPELRGAYVFGDWETRRLWAARFEGARVKEMPEIARPSVRIVAFGEDTRGELYFLDHDGGTVHTIERNEVDRHSADFPTTLSQTGLFAHTADQQPAAGVIPFTISSRQWQDGATAEHWVAFPGQSSAMLHAEGKPIPVMVDWHNFRLHFPENAVLAKTISLVGRKMETQILHFDGLDWQPYTYAWRDDQSDADLVASDGAEREMSLGNERLVWQFHSRTQCRSCHSPWSEFALAFQPEQLNRPGADGRNQLVSLSQLGLIHRVDAGGKPLPAFDDASAARERKLADPTNAKLPIEDRARAYLHANCGHCHSTGGGGAVALRLQFPVAVKEMKAVGERPARGDFGLPGACIIQPGDPLASTLYFRMAKFGRDRMPHLGSERPDEAGLRIVEEWIAGMKADGVNSAPQHGSSADEASLADSTAAMRAARRLGKGELPPGERQRVLAAAAQLPVGPVRDLFEGYLPADEKGKRLGTSPRPASILSLSGDAGRGATLFWSSTVNCGSCHKIADRGSQVGPELTTIGRERTREDLLESLLEPSRRIEPRFAAYAARASDGSVVTGLVVKRDAAGVVLRDAQNKEVALAADDIQQLRPSQRSLMPDGQMAGLTAQEAADLLAYVASLR